MNWLPLVLYVVSLLHSVLGSLPAPHNVSISSSFNFHHVLRWDPGPGTPPGTQYKINRRINSKELKQLPYSNTTSLTVKFPRYTDKYVLTVQASYNQTLSPKSHEVHFTPFLDTTIGPPTVSLAGCGNCIQINISLPEVDQHSRVKDDMRTIYPGVSFSVFWRKPNEAVESITTKNSSVTVNNLQTGTEYCVQVWTKINVNRKTQLSAWNCTFTSIVEPSRDVYVIGAAAALVLLVSGVLMTLMFCLHYTGFICKLETLPRVLHKALSPGSTLTPERTIPDKIAISTEPEKQNKRNNGQPTRGSNSEEEEEEEEEGENVYMDRGADISSGESSGQDSANVLENSKVAASGGSGSLIAEVPDTETEVEVTHDEAKADGEEVSFMPEGPVSGEVVEEVEEEEEEYKEEVCESSGNINLFSVTLAALAVGEEEEEEQNERDPLTDFLKVSDLEPLLPSDSQTESGDQTTVALMLQEDSTVSGHEGRRANTSDGESQDEETQEEEEEEEEEEFSGYMCHR